MIFQPKPQSFIVLLLLWKQPLTPRNFWWKHLLFGHFQSTQTPLLLTLIFCFLKIESLSSNPTNENEMSVTSFLFWPIKLAFVVDKWMRVIKEKAKGYASEKVVLFWNSAHCISSWLKFRLSFVSVSSKKLGTRLWWSRPESQLITKLNFQADLFFRL